MSHQVRLALIGKAGSGKDYVASVLRARGLRVERFAYADEIKVQAFRVLDEIVAQPDAYSANRAAMIAWVDARKHLPSVRGLLQHLGEAAKVLSGNEELWASVCRHFYRNRLDDPAVDALVITDCRTLREAAGARRDGFSIVRVTRTDDYQGAGMTAENAGHRSEVEQDCIVADYELLNDGTERFDADILLLVERLRHRVR